MFARKMRVGIKGCFSDWYEVFSGVPQGSSIGPLLFLIFVNDLPEWILNSMRMFADDTNLWKKVKTDQDSVGLQDDLCNSMEWNEEWLLNFNVKKCKVMHVGHGLEMQYYLEENGVKINLESTVEEKDLGVLVTSDLKVGNQCRKAASKAMSILGMIRRSFDRIDKDDFQILYKTYIRPCVEYCVQAWSPYLVKDVQCLERVQRRATKLVYELKGLAYEERLKHLGLTTLEQRRLRGDLILTYKLLTNRMEIDASQFFQLRTQTHNTRGHRLKLYVPGVRTNIRKNSFSQRVLEHWNGLPAEVVDAESVNAFKTMLDSHWSDMGI